MRRLPTSPPPQILLSRSRPPASFDEHPPNCSADDARSRLAVMRWSMTLAPANARTG